MALHTFPHSVGLYLVFRSLLARGQIAAERSMGKIDAHQHHRALFVSLHRLCPGMEQVIHGVSVRHDPAGMVSELSIQAGADTVTNPVGYSRDFGDRAPHRYADAVESISGSSHRAHRLFRTWELSGNEMGAGANQAVRLFFR